MRIVPRLLTLSLGVLLIGPVSGKAQDYREDLGYWTLQSELGAAMPTGSGIGLSQIEAPLDEALTIYLPDIAGYASEGKTITPKSGPGSTSSHATTVGTFFYSLYGSMAPGTTMIDAYEVNNWIGDGFLRTASTHAPRAELQKVENHSWIGTTYDPMTMTNYDVEILRRFDYAIQTSDFVATVGLNNGSETPIPPLLASSYNAISVGLSNSGSSNGFTTVDGNGRIKPEIVANPYIMQTSFATPTVGSAAAILREAAQAVSANAQHSVTLKALLLAGATKHQFPLWNRTTTRPLDIHFGAGQVNVYNSYHILAAGQQAASNSVSVNRRGWDYSTTNAGSKLYFFDIPLGDTASGLSAILTWHRIITTAPTWPATNSNVPNLSLKIYAASGFVIGALVDQSVSPVDNVEHLYEPNLSPGRYVLEVTGDQTGITYGLAWNTVPTVSVTAADASEQGLSTGTFTFTRLGDTANDLIVHYTISGSATEGSDYGTLPLTVTIPANQLTAIVNVTPLADSVAEGDETVTLTLTSNFAYGFDAPGSATVTIHDLPFDAWRFAHFTAAELANQAISGELADFDGDGIVTLAEYGLGLDPKVANVTGLPTLGRDANNHPTLTYTRDSSATDITYIPEFTTNFATWTAISESASPIPAELQTLISTVTVTSPYSLNAEPKQFLRLRITRP
jgi:hypothetical protein